MVGGYKFPPVKQAVRELDTDNSSWSTSSLSFRSGEEVLHFCLLISLTELRIRCIPFSELFKAQQTFLSVYPRAFVAYDKHCQTTSNVSRIRRTARFGSFGETRH